MSHASYSSTYFIYTRASGLIIQPNIGNMKPCKQIRGPGLIPQAQR